MRIPKLSYHLPALSWLLMALVATAACTKQQMYRPDNIVKGPGYTLGFVEFDDQGEPWSPRQTERVIAVIEEANRAKNGAVVMVFVHGWKNNASPEQEQQDGYALNGFNRLLTETVQGLRASYPTTPPQVVGVYVGWRGKSAKTLEVFSFYGRRRAASRVAGTAATGTLFEILAVANQNPESRVMLVGHSFGGLVVEEVVSDVMAGVLLGAPGPEAEFPADLVVLLNPASPAVYAKQLVDLLIRKGITLYRVDANGKRYERPLLVSITSVADTATRVAFPIGNMLGTLGRRYRDYGPEFCSPGTSQRTFQRQTAGHTEVLHSHLVTTTARAAPAGFDVWGGRIDRLNLQVEPDPATRGLTISFDGENQRVTISKKLLTLNDTPYWIMRVPKSLIRDHSDIFRPNTIRMVAAIARATGVVAPGTRTVMIKETTVRPLGMGLLSSGDLLFVDQLRRIYSVAPGSSHPDLIGCYPHAIDPAEVIGGHQVDVDITFITNTLIPGESKKKDKTRYETQLIHVPDIRHPASGKPVVFDSDTRFQSAAIDPRESKVYLATADRLYVADLSRRKPRPEPLVPLQTSDQVGWMQFDAKNKRLLLPDTELGRLYSIELGGKAPEVQQIARDLGSPAQVKIDQKTGSLYIADSKGKKIWRLPCQQGRCGKPQVFARSPEFTTPRYLAVAPDGSLWVGDPQARKIFAVGATGKIQRTISSLIP